MNVGNVTNAASKAADKVSTVNNATNAANTTTNVTSNSAMPGQDMLSNVSDALMVNENEENKKIENKIVEANGGEKPKLESGTKVDTGKAINSEGEVDDSSTKKVLTAVGRGAAAYFSGGNSLGADQSVTKFKPIDKTIGVVSDTVDKVPGIGAVTKELDDAGVADGVNDALDVVGNVKNGDIQGTIESAKGLKKDTKKLRKYILKKALIIAIPVMSLFFVVIIFVVVIGGPVIGGALDLIEDIGEKAEIIAEQAKEFVFGDDEEEETIELASEIVNYDDLSEGRKKIVSWALVGLTSNVKYKWGNKPTGAGLSGLPSGGLDCSGFVMWVYWSALGTKPTFSSTGSIATLIGSQFVEVSASELQPGDIGLKYKGYSSEKTVNHTGIYVGNGQWIHDTSSPGQVVRNNYSGFTVYLRYKGID